MSQIQNLFEDGLLKIHIENVHVSLNVFLELFRFRQSMHKQEIVLSLEQKGFLHQLKAQGALKSNFHFIYSIDNILLAGPVSANLNQDDTLLRHHKTTLAKKKEHHNNFMYFFCFYNFTTFSET